MNKWSRIEPEASDDGKGVAIARVYRDPPAVAGFSESPEIRRAHGGFDQPAAAEHVRNSPRAVIGIIAKRFMSSAEPVRFRAKLIRRPYGALNRQWGIFRRRRLAITQLGHAAGHGWTGHWERAGRVRNRKTRAAEER